MSELKNERCCPNWPVEGYHVPGCEYATGRRPLGAKRDAAEAVIEAARKAFGDFSCRHAHQMDCGSFCHLARAVAAYDAALSAIRSKGER